MFSVVSVVCYLVEVSTTDRSLVQGSPTKYGVAECDVETSTMRSLLPTRGGGLFSHDKKNPVYCTTYKQCLPQNWNEYPKNLVIPHSRENIF
jgi:hypothetical protein